MHRHEHVPLPALTAAMLQMLDDGLADVAGQREPFALVGLAVDDDQPGAPIEIVDRSRETSTARNPSCASRSRTA